MRPASSLQWHLPSVHSAVQVRPPGTLCQEQLLTSDNDLLGTFKSRLKTFSVFSSFQLTLTLPAASASEVTT